MDDPGAESIFSGLRARSGIIPANARSERVAFLARSTDVTERWDETGGGA
jgi:hypothetical protein